MRPHIRCLAVFFHLALGALGLVSPAQSQVLAFSFDDGPHLSATPRLSPAERNQALLRALAQHDVTAALFVTCGNGADRPEGLELVRAWSAAGHAIGNHTMSHPDLHAKRVSLAQYQQEILDCQRILAPLPGVQPWFRFTYLREGNTPEKRDGMRAFLKEQGLRNAYVTLDSSDWRLNELLERRLASEPQADLAPIKAAYLAHLSQRAQAYRALALELEGREVKQMLLLHHNLINALWLGDVIAQFKAQGWRIESPQQVFDDPIYARQPERAAPGQSLLLSIARSQGRGRLPGWERLVDDGEFEIEQLKAQGIQ
ncbi:polysaccharide deacetylase family protein [Inhella inkyongensis]|uniref:polysaccharide deacetylase family protein n=1 Tax=Inhella inkyongensis TaxID=392593 RepID=UPI00110D3C97|nr:polysaccharide deacetylase family protein [Inhella inkyongensis]